MYFTEFNIAAIIVIASLAVYCYIKYGYSFWKRQGIPYLEPTFLFGNIKPLLFRKICFGEMMANLHFQLKEKGVKFGGIFSLTVPSLMIIDPDLVKEIFIKNFSSFCDRGLYYNEEVDPLSAHIAAISNPKWQFLRFKFSPTFTPAKIKMVCPIFEDCGMDMVAVVETFAENNIPLDARDIMSRYTTDIIGNSTFKVMQSFARSPVVFRCFIKILLFTLLWMSLSTHKKSMKKIPSYKNIICNGKFFYLSNYLSDIETKLRASFTIIR